MTDLDTIEFLDTHQHLIYPETAGYAWTNDLPELAGKAFPLEQYARLTKDKGIAATIFMEAGVDDPDYKREVHFITELAKDPANRIKGIIASCRLEQEGFEAWLDECADLPVVGFRGLLHALTNENVASPVSLENAKKIGARGLVFDLCGPLAMMPNAAKIARATENTAFVLDHCGVPDIAGGDMTEWKRGLSQLAELPHVACKISGVTAYCGPGTASLETVRPYLDFVVECFGTDRLIWGSDWPVVNMGKGIGEWIDISRAYLSTFSRDEQVNIASANAARLYKVAL